MASPDAARDLDSDQPEDPNLVEIAWSEEIERRVKTIREGTAETVSEEEFLRRLRSAK